MCVCLCMCVCACVCVCVMCVYVCVCVYVHVCVCVCVCVHACTILSGCPARMRSDHGTENVTIATCQMAFRHYHGDRYAGANSFIFGSSIRNCVSCIGDICVHAHS